MATQQPQKKIFHCTNRSEAAQELKRRQTALPAAQSAYVPSGIMPPGAFPLMLTAAVAGVPGGLMAGAAVLVVGTLLAMLLGGIFVGIADACKTWVCCPVILMFITALLTYAGMYCAIGVACSSLVTRLGEKKQNRNASVAGTLSALSAFVATILFVVLARQFSGGSKDIREAWDLVFGM